METVVISPKYQIVIPLRIRKALGLKPGQELRVIQFDQRIEYVSVEAMQNARGFLKGIETNVARGDDRV